MGYALGIDLGTTFTAAAVSRNGRVEIVGMGNHASAIPSAVLLRDDGTLLVGDAALRRGQQEPARLAKEFKRRLGDATPIILGHTPYSAERLMAAVVRHVVDTVSERQGERPDAVTIAHPANWGPYKRELLEQAAAIAGLSNVRFVTEPEAAAVHFAAGERVDEGGIVAVYDLGGGTFDAAVLRRVGDRFVTMGQPQGIERLGGIDFDESVLSHVRVTLGEAFSSLDSTEPVVRSAMIRLRSDCVAAKEALSDDSETVVPVMAPGLQTQVRLTRPEFESMIRPVLRETVAMLNRALDFAGVSASALSAVVLAGGSSRIPLVAEMVGEALGRPVSVDAHPKDTVAMGAARLASADAGGSGQPLPPVTVAPPVAPVPPAPGPPAPVASPQAPAAPPDAPAPPLAAAAVPKTLRAAAPAAGAARRSPGQPPRRQGRAKELVGAALILAGAIGVGGYLLFGRAGGDASSDEPGVDTTDAPLDTTGTPGTSGIAATVAPTTPLVVVTQPDIDETDPAVEHTDPPAQTTEPDTGDDGVGTRTCTAATGRCVFIDDVTLDGDNVVVDYTTVGYEAHVGQGADSHHVHFYFDTVPVTQAGIPADSHNWVAWGLEEGNGDSVYTFAASSIPQGATQVCASVANVNHGLDDHAFQCVRLPRS